MNTTVAIPIENATLPEWGRRRPSTAAVVAETIMLMEDGIEVHRHQEGATCVATGRRFHNHPIVVSSRLHRSRIATIGATGTRQKIAVGGTILATWMIAGVLTAEGKETATGRETTGNEIRGAIEWQAAPTSVVVAAGMVAMLALTTGAGTAIGVVTEAREEMEMKMGGAIASVTAQRLRRCVS